MSVCRIRLILWLILAGTTVLGGIVTDLTLQTSPFPMGLANLVGSIAVGKEANLAVIDKDINVYLTMVKGRIVYNNL